MLQPKFNRYPKPTDWNSLIILAQQAFEDGFRGPTFTDLVRILSSIIKVNGSSAFRGDALPSTDPGAPEAEEWYWAKAGETYTNFLDENGDPIEVPETVGSDSVIMPRLVFNGDYWVVDYDLFNLSGYATKEEAVKVEDLDMVDDTGSNIFDPEVVYPGNGVLVCGGGMNSSLYPDGVTGVIQGIKPNTSYYIQGRGIRNALRFYNSSGVGLAATNGANFCSGPANGVYVSPATAYEVRFAIFWDGGGADKNQVMFFEGTEPKPFFEPYNPETWDKIKGVNISARKAYDMSDNRYKSANEIIEKNRVDNFIIEHGSEQIFDKDTMIRYDYSLSITGNSVSDPGSMMSTDIPVDASKGNLTIAGRVFRRPFVFLTEDGTKIPSTFADYNSGPLNGTYPIPPNAKKFRFAISYQGDGDGSEHVIMINYGESPLPYEPYSPTGVRYINIGGVQYPLLAEGGEAPSSSSFKFQGVKWDGTDLTILSKFNDNFNLKTIFRITGNNDTFLPNRSGKIPRSNNGIYEVDFDAEITNPLLRWYGTDGIGPYRLTNSVDNGLFVGGNHGQPEPPPYAWKTSNCLSYEIWADGVKMNPGDIVDAKVIKVLTLNEVYSIDGLFGEPSQNIVDFHERQETTVIDGVLYVRVDCTAQRPATFRTIYGLQAQVGGVLQQVYFPHSDYVDVEARTVNPDTGSGRSYGVKTDHPDFEKFIAMTTDKMDCTAIWMDMSKGVATKSRLGDTAPIARGKLGKLYHNCLNLETPLDTGESLFYEGAATVFSNLGTPEQNTFAYFQWEKGDQEWEYSRYLYCDFAGTSSGRSIVINYPEIRGKTLELVWKDDTVTVPGSLLVTPAGITINNTGHGCAKFLVP